jgi:hypothetical protein
MQSVRVPDAQVLDVSGWEEWLPTVTGTQNVERATQWVNLFRYHRQTQIVSNASASLNEAIECARSTVGQKSILLVEETSTGSCTPDSAKAVCRTDKNVCGNQIVQNCRCAVVLMPFNLNVRSMSRCLLTQCLMVWVAVFCHIPLTSLLQVVAHGLKPPVLRPVLGRITVLLVSSTKWLVFVGS